MQSKAITGHTGNIYFYNNHWYDYIWQVDNEITISLSENKLYRKILSDKVTCSEIKFLRKEDIELFILHLLENTIRWDSGFLKPHTVVCLAEEWLINGYCLAEILNLQEESKRENKILLSSCKDLLKNYTNENEEK